MKIIKVLLAFFASVCFLIAAAAIIFVFYIPFMDMGFHTGEDFGDFMIIAYRFMGMEFISWIVFIISAGIGVGCIKIFNTPRQITVQ